MGFVSYTCKECGHSVLSHYSTDPEINGWMKEAVILTPNGSRIIGEYGGYGDIAGMSVGEGHISADAVWVHQACWEVAGRPEYDHYDGPSPSADDQGYFFDKEHDVIDPRITDETERERLLAEGVEIRERRRYDDRARKVAEWLDPEEREFHTEEKRREPWRNRYSYSPALKRDADGEYVRDDDGYVVDDPNGWRISDEIGTGDSRYEEFRGTEDELKAELAARWATFVESDEAAAYVARREEVRQEYLLERIEQLKEEGRFQPTYGPRTIDGEEKWPVYFVMDELYASGDDLREECWHGEGCKTKAQEKADRLNAEWAAAGYPAPEKA